MALEPRLQAFVDQVEAGVAEQKADGEFELIRQDLFGAQVCTSLSDNEATTRMNLVPSGTSYGWQLDTDPANAPVQCASNPATRRHLLFEC